MLRKKLLQLSLLLFFAVIILNVTATLPSFLAKAVAEEKSENLALILVIDKSGSMAQTDPTMLRETASHIFIDLLNPDDYLGAIVFDQTAEVAIPLQAVQDTTHKEEFKKILSARIQPRGNTDFKAALEAALLQFNKTDLGGRRPVVLFLTDGDPDPNPALKNDSAFMNNYMVSFWDTVTKFTLMGCPIYTVGFSSEVDSAVINQMAHNTLAASFVLKDASDLAVTFFNLLGELKNEEVFLEKEFALGEGQQSFSFTVNDFTRQVNIVAVNPEAQNVSLAFEPPGGKKEAKEALMLDSKGKYILAVVDGNLKDAKGEWKVNVSGKGKVKVLGGKELLLKAWLEEPPPFSEHPFNEPLKFKVRLSREGLTGDLPLTAEAWITKPDAAQASVVNLTPTRADYFEGEYTDLDKEGTYGIMLRVLKEGELISTNSTEIYVKPVPSLVSNFQLKDKYRLGEEQVVTAFLNFKERRLTKGTELLIDKFNLVFRYANGENVVLSLADDGNTAKNGDAKAMDGIWSQKLILTKEGKADVSILAKGKYKGSDFLLEKNIGEIEVYPPGKVRVSILKSDLWAKEGGKLIIPLELKSESPFTETIIAKEDTALGQIENPQIILRPLETKKVELKLNLDKDLREETPKTSLTFAAAEGLTEITPASFEFSFAVLPWPQAWLKALSSPLRGPLRTEFMGLIALLAFAYLGGMGLYGVRVLPRTRPRGTLFFWPIDPIKAEEESNGNDGSAQQDTKNKIEMKKAGKKGRIVISFNPENKDADLIIENSSFTYDLILETIFIKNGLCFVLGWQSLGKKEIPVKTTIRCTPPGIIEFQGEVYTSKDLFPGDEFVSGNYVFRYIGDKNLKKKEKGADILEGRM